MGSLDSLQKPARMGVVGNLEVDLVLGPLSRLPKWGEERVVTTREMRAAGSAGYTAFALGHLGHSPFLIGPLGDDSEGRVVRCAMREAGLTEQGLQIMERRRTGLSITLVREDGERCFVNHLGCLADYSKDDLEEMMPQLLSLDIVLLSGYFLMPALRGEPILSLFKTLKKERIQTALDTGDSTEGWTREVRSELQPILAVTDWFFPNRDELEGLTQISDVQTSCEYLLGIGTGHVVLKLGHQGAMFFGPADMYKQSAISIDVVDTVGAGDVFNAGFLAGWAEGLSVGNCLRLATATAASYIGSTDRSFPSREKVEKIMADSNWQK